MSKESNLKAFTVKPHWAFLIAQGYKDVENRRVTPSVKTGTVAVHVSSNYSRSEYEAFISEYPKDVRKQLTYDLLHDLCGKIICIVDYEVKESTDSKWWMKIGNPIMLKNPRWLSEPFVPCKGFLGFWSVPDGTAKDVYAMLMPEQ